MAFPTALAIWGTLGAVTTFRALVRPCRALIEYGDAVVCPGGTNCSPSLTVQSSRGIGRVYALVSGRITRAIPGGIELGASSEPVLLGMTGITPTVSPGQDVQAGQAIGQAQAVSLTVTQIQRLAGGAVTGVSLEPASWLAARGLRAANHSGPSALWCAQGRKLVIPQAVAQCGMRLPDPAGFALLPVSARLE